MQISTIDNSTFTNILMINAFVTYYIVLYVYNDFTTIMSSNSIYAYNYWKVNEPADIVI